MGFSLRKSIRLGKSLKLNISKGGIGISGGVKGARLSAGPRGVQLRAGAGPLRYQKTLVSSAHGDHESSPDPASNLSMTEHVLEATPPPSELNSLKLIAALLLCFIAGYVILNSIPKEPEKSAAKSAVQVRTPAQSKHIRRAK